MSITVSGAYGRDYNSKAAVLADWHDNKDFIVRSFNGSGYMNKADADRLRETVSIRYKRDTMQLVVKPNSPAPKVKS